MRSILGRLAGLGLAAAAAVSLTGGCVGQHYVNRTLYGYGEKPQDHRHPLDVPYVPVVPESGINTFALENTPAGVQSNFHSDYAGATITGVDQVPTGTGLMLYRVKYIEDGAPGAVVYRDNGSVFGSPEERIIVRDDGADYHPRPAPRPTTNPSHAELQ